MNQPTMRDLYRDLADRRASGKMDEAIASYRDMIARLPLVSPTMAAIQAYARDRDRG